MVGQRFCGNCGLNLQYLTPTQQQRLVSTGLCPRCGAMLATSGDVLASPANEWRTREQRGSSPLAHDLADLATIQSAAREAHARANNLRNQGMFRDAEQIDITALQTLRPLVQAIAGKSGWLGTARLMIDSTRLTQIDTLQSATWPLAAVRLSVLLAIPNVTTIVSLEQIAKTIRAAVLRGAPTYNAGDPRGCATIYWATGLTLAEAPLAQGIVGLPRAIKPIKQALETALPSIGDDAHAIEDFAWWMRHSLDGALAVTQE